MRRWMLAPVLAMSVTACDAQMESALRKVGSELAEMTVRELGDLASRVAEDPAVADSVLAANGVDLGQLDSIMGALGGEAEKVGAAFADMRISDVGDLASRIAEDRSVADSLLAANGIEAGQLDGVLDELGGDAEALAAYLARLGREQNR